MIGALVAPLVVAAGLAGPGLPAQRGETPGAERRLARLAWDDELPPGYGDDEEAPRPHVLLSAWSGEALAAGGSGRSGTFFAAEAAWAFEHLDLGVQGAEYQRLRDDARAWTPVMLLRLTQRFRGRRGAEIAFGFGLGAGRPKDWTAWYQVSLGVRVPIGPLFLAGELAFEQYDLLRLGGGIGVAF